MFRKFRLRVLVPNSEYLFSSEKQILKICFLYHTREIFIERKHFFMIKFHILQFHYIIRVLKESNVFSRSQTIVILSWANYMFWRMIGCHFQLNSHITLCNSFIDAIFALTTELFFSCAHKYWAVENETFSKMNYFQNPSSKRQSG